MSKIPLDPEGPEQVIVEWVTREIEEDIREYFETRGYVFHDLKPEVLYQTLCQSLFYNFYSRIRLGLELNAVNDEVEFEELAADNGHTAFAKAVVEFKPEGLKLIERFSKSSKGGLN